MELEISRGVGEDRDADRDAVEDDNDAFHLLADADAEADDAAPLSAHRVVI